MIPSQVLSQLQEKEGIKIVDYQPISGWCINSCYRINTPTEVFFLKWNSASLYPQMFEMEAKGLELLTQHATFTIPKVNAYGETEDYSWLLMEYIETSTPSSNYWEELGTKLAQMHRISDPFFGLNYDNYIGSLTQKNTREKEWSEFFINQRIVPQLKRAINTNRLGKKVEVKFKSLFKKLPGIFPKEPPALLHGDLWSGNLQPDGSGSPCLFDPAVYFGNREMEIAFTQLFGGFDQRFYDAYNHSFPLTPEFDHRISIYNLYPLLVHVNLFGGGYINQVKKVINAYS